MGEYLSRFYEIKEAINQGNTNKAYLMLKDLLLNINDDFIASNDVKDKLFMSTTIEKLLPSLNDLKNNTISNEVVKMFDIDLNTFTKKEDKVVGVENYDQKENQTVDKLVNESTNNSEKPVCKVSKINKKRNILVPLTLDDYIGQEKAKEVLSIAINAAKIKDSCLSHMLICSPYGIGKTTLANIVANEMEMPFVTVNAVALKDVKSLMNFFEKINDRCVIFIDEIHRLSKSIQSVLLTIITDYVVDYINEAGDNIHVDLPEFTLIGATTQAGELLKPFINRFTLLELTDYTDEEKKQIVKYSLHKSKVITFSFFVNAKSVIPFTYVSIVLGIPLQRFETSSIASSNASYPNLSNLDFTICFFSSSV